MGNFSTKIAATVSMIALSATVLGTTAVAAASEFLPYAELLADNDVIGVQSAEAGYRLGATITRAELAKVTANLGGYVATDCAGTVYGDVSSTLGDLCGYVEALAEAGVVSTANANFRPNASVTRAEMIKMVLGGLGEESSDFATNHSDTANLGDLTGYINRATEMGCANDGMYFRPSATSSRGETFKIASCVAGLDEPTVVVPPTPTSTGVTSTGVTTTTGATVAGAVTVALDGTAVAQYVPKNASSVKVGSVKLSAGTAGATISSLVVTRSGLGNVVDISAVQLAQAGVAVSDSRTLSTSSQSATLKFNPALMLKAGTSATVDILVSLSGSENNQHQFAVTAVNALTSTVSGTPVTLGLLNTTSYTVGNLVVDSIAAGSVTSGKTNQTFATVKFTPNREATLAAFTISKGTGEDYTKVMSNVSAYHNNVKIGSVMVGTDKIYVTGLNLARLSGEQATIELKGDATYVGPTATTTFKIAESTDVSGVEKTTGYAMSVTGASNTAQTLALNALDLTITKTSTGTRTVSPGTSAIELYNAKVTSDATFDVSMYNVALTTGANLADFVNGEVTIYINGIDYIMGANTKNFSASADRFRVEPGVPVTVRIVGNVKSNAVTVPADYVFTLNITEVKNVSNGSTLAVAKSQVGDKTTVKNGTAVLKNSTVAAPSSRVVYANADLEVGRFGVTAEAEKVTLRKITVTNGATTTPVTDWTTIVSSNSVKLVNAADGTQVSATVTVTAGSVVFDNMSVEVEKDTTKNFKVVATTSGFTAAEHGKKIAVAVALNTVDKASGGAATVSNTFTVATTNPYRVGVVPPTVNITKKSAKVFLVTVTNVDSESSITLDAIKARVKPVATNNSNYTALYCLRAEGSSVSTCPEAITSTGSGSVPGPAANLAIVTPQSISKNGSSYSYEILVDSNFVDPTDLLGEVLQITYSTTTTPGLTEDYSKTAQ
jgi:S-layer homology domain